MATGTDPSRWDQCSRSCLPAVAIARGLSGNVIPSKPFLLLRFARLIRASFLSDHCCCPSAALVSQSLEICSSISIDSCLVEHPYPRSSLTMQASIRRVRAWSAFPFIWRCNELTSKQGNQGLPTRSSRSCTCVPSSTLDASRGCTFLRERPWSCPRLCWTE